MSEGEVGPNLVGVVFTQAMIYDIVTGANWQHPVGERRISKGEKWNKIDGAESKIK